jgi:nitronate monooxygenase
MESTSTVHGSLCDLLGIKYPIIMAPMFLVSNKEMVIEALKSGITGAIPALNYRTTEELTDAIRAIKQAVDGPFGINLIVNKSNFLYKEQLKVCCDEHVDYIITSLGSPEETIRQAHAVGIKVFCDVTDEFYAKKVEDLGADGLIAVNREAGGHAGPTTYKELIPRLLKTSKIPVISAGGIGTKEGIEEVLALGAAGLSIGSLFIASEEAPVSKEYKEACVDYDAKGIVMTTKLSGTPCSVINTPYVQEIGTQQNWLERIMSKHKKLKKWFKAFTYYKGMKKLQHAAFGATYKTMWVAGPSIDHVHAVKPVRDIVKDLVG